MFLLRWNMKNKPFSLNESLCVSCSSTAHVVTPPSHLDGSELLPPDWKLKKTLELMINVVFLKAKRMYWTK